MQQRLDLRVAVIVGLFLVIALTPFTIYHFWQREWIVGSTTLFAQTVVLLAVVNYIRRGITAFTYAMIILATFTGDLAAIANLWTVGSAAVFWIFPAIVINFYILPFSAALPASLIMVSLSAWVTWDLLAPAFWIRMSISMTVTVILGIAFSAYLARQKAELLRLANVDPLTGASNRRSLDEALLDAIYTQNRYRQKTSLILLDVDHFKNINDTHGHMVGDIILQELAARISQHLRRSDRLFRFGGEEFVVLTPHIGRVHAIQLAEKVRRAIAESSMGPGLLITVSAGIAELNSGDEVIGWLQRADQALYRAKNDGRNRVYGEPALL